MKLQSVALPYPQPTLPSIDWERLRQTLRALRGQRRVIVARARTLLGALVLMAVTHPTATRNLAADTIVDQINAGTPPGKLIFQTSGGVTVATLTFSNTSFGAASSGTKTANSITSDTDAVGGTIAKAELRNAAGTAIVLCSVTAVSGGGDIELSSVVISAHQTVAMTSLTYTAMP